MARHRDVRNLDADDFGDDDYDYGSSYGSSHVDEVELSKSMERDYIYRRGSDGGGGHTPKIGYFVGPDADDGPPGRIRQRSDSETSSSSNSNLWDDLGPDDAQKLAECLEHILDVVGESMPEDRVKEAIVRCDFQKEVALNTLLNNPVGHSVAGGKSQQRRRRVSPRPSVSSFPDDVPDTTTNVDPVPIGKNKNKTKAGKPTEAVTVTKAEPPPPAAHYNKDLPTVKTGAAGAIARLQPSLASEAAAIRSRSQSPSVASGAGSGRGTPILVTKSGSSSTPSKVQMRKGKLDPLQEYERERGKEKDLLNLVVVGHVDSGKSTLMGHLLFRLGTVGSKAMHKYEQESKKVGKQSFAYAWVLDETSEERERGITMDVGQSRFETPRKAVTLLDAPGHKDFIPNMISGAYQADVAILVINATRGEFEAGFEAGGQTREHALLVRSLGVSQLAVAVNKLDTVDWSQARFDEIVGKLRQFLKMVGFKEADVSYIPCSGFTGDNLEKASERLGWYDGNTLLEAIDNFKPPERVVQKPFRLSISDIFKAQSSTGLTVSGRVEAGFVQKDDKVLIMPLNDVATVKSVTLGDGTSMPSSSAFAGDHVCLALVGISDHNSVANGMVACDPATPITVTKRIKARIVVFNIEVPITKGFPVVFHYGSVQTQAVIKRLVATVNKSTGEVMKRKPRCLSRNCNALVEIATDAPVCMEVYSESKELGRFMLRVGGKTIAAGLVTELL